MDAFRWARHRALSVHISVKAAILSKLHRTVEWHCLGNLGNIIWETTKKHSSKKTDRKAIEELIGILRLLYDPLRVTQPLKYNHLSSLISSY